jgi:hypothetical protein
MSEKGQKNYQRLQPPERFSMLSSGRCNRCVKAQTNMLLNIFKLIKSNVFVTP